MTWVCVPSGLAVGLLLAGAALACPLDTIEDRLTQADEHLFWVEFWTEMDDGEAQRELGYAADDLRRAAALLRTDPCRDDAKAQDWQRIVRQRLAACTRQLDTMETIATGQMSRRDH